MEHLVDEDTGILKEDIPTVLDYLFTNYRNISSEEVKQKEAEVLAMIFNPAKLVVLLYCPIKQLQKVLLRWAYHICKNNS